MAVIAHIRHNTKNFSYHAEEATTMKVISKDSSNEAFRNSLVALYKGKLERLQDESSGYSYKAGIGWGYEQAALETLGRLSLIGAASTVPVEVKLTKSSDLRGGKSFNVVVRVKY